MASQTARRDAITHDQEGPALTSHAALSEHDVHWRVLMVTPSGYVEVVEVRAQNEAMALDTVRYWKPCHRVASDPSGNPILAAFRASP
jgi:hypothetical protein